MFNKVYECLCVHLCGLRVELEWDMDPLETRQLRIFVLQKPGPTLLRPLKSAHTFRQCQLLCLHTPALPELCQEQARKEP